jgi:hypothetical protein
VHAIRKYEGPNVAKMVEVNSMDARRASLI